MMASHVAMGAMGLAAFQVGEKNISNGESMVNPLKTQVFHGFFRRPDGGKGLRFHSEKFFCRLDANIVWFCLKW